MSLTNSPFWLANPGGGGSFYPVTIDDSLRWPTSGCQLYRTVGTPTDAKKHTHAFWVKVNPGTTQTLNSVYANQSGYYSNSGINSDGRIIFGADYARYYYSTMRLRDPSSWVHILQVLDSTEATGTDRLKLYVNGVRQTSFTNYGTPPLNWTGSYHATNGFGLRIGRTYTGGGFQSSLLSYTSEYIFVDGQALDPTDFGQFKDGVWIPDTYAGTYGNNGYKLDFSNPANFGEDSSGNSNNFSVTGFSTHDAMPDTPTNNFATLNPIFPHLNMTFSEGNLKWTTTTNSRGAMGNFSIPIGTGQKYYFEYVQTGWANVSGDDAYVGLNVDNVDIDSARGGRPTSYSYGANAGNKVINGTQTSYGVAWGTGDIIGIAVDRENNTINFAKNNAYQGTFAIPATGNLFAWIGSGGGSNAASGVWNFGQDSTFAGVTTAGGNSDANGNGDFKYAPPSGFLALCSANLPEPVVGPLGDSLSGDNFNAVLWTGNSTNNTVITGVGFQPDWVWIKQRSGGEWHRVQDTVRGVSQQLYSNAANAEATTTNNLLSVNSDGFTLGTDSAVNYSGSTYVGWNWKAGGTAVANTDGSITSQVSANVDAGFSIVSYVGTGSAATVGHGLSSIPEFIIVKNRSNTGGWSWVVYDKTNGANKYLYLNGTAASATYNMWNNTSPTSSVFSVSGYTGTNGSSDTMIAYCFHSVDGYSKTGTYTGNGANQFIYTGFRPAFVMSKVTSGADNWRMYDSARLGYNPNNSVLYPNLPNPEDASTDHIDLLANGFKWMSDNNNANGHTFIYIAFAQNPFKYANAR